MFNKFVVLLTIVVIIVMAMTACGAVNPAETSTASASNPEQNVEEIDAIVFDVDADTYAYGQHQEHVGRKYYAYAKTNDGTLIEVFGVDRSQYLELNQRLQHSDSVAVTLRATQSYTGSNYEIVIRDAVHTTYTANGHYYTNGIIMAVDGMMFQYTAPHDDYYDDMPIIVEIDDNGTPTYVDDDFIIDIYADPTAI